MMTETVLEGVDENQPEAVVGKIVTKNKVVDATTENIKKVLKGKKDNPKPKKDPLLERSNTIKRDEFFDAIVKEFPEAHIKKVNTSNPEIQEPVLYYSKTRILQGAVSSKYWWSAYLQTSQGRNIIPVTNNQSEKEVHNFIQTRIEEIEEQIKTRESKKTETKNNSKPKTKKSKNNTTKVPKNSEEERKLLLSRLEKHTSKNGLDVPSRIDEKSEWFTNLCEEHNLVFNTDNRTVKQGN